jgi:hypothetical protein
MLYLTLEQTADYLEMATVEKTIDDGHAIIHFGKNAAGVCFVMMNDANGKTTVSEEI